MFVQIDELPSMYSRPRLSRKIAPRPSTSTSGSCSGPHQSRMSVNGCQTNFLSAAISSSVFHSVIAASFLDQFLHAYNLAVVSQLPDEGGPSALRSWIKFLRRLACCNPPLP